MFLLVLVLSVTWLLWPWVWPYSVHTCPWQIRTKLCLTEARSLLPEEHSIRQMTQRGRNSTFGLLAPEPTHQQPTLTSLVPGTLSPGLCELRTLLRAHEFPADLAASSLPLSLFLYPSMSISLSEGGIHVIRIFLLPPSISDILQVPGPAGDLALSPRTPETCFNHCHELPQAMFQKTNDKLGALPMVLLGGLSSKDEILWFRTKLAK